ncbi:MULTISPECIES: hypothetical protein [unclassified Flavobacterium]|uniref:hypothetical protein n=1 Tax=unclassified Flavobacterium TaxID=196869 RepID=UPI000F84E77E|nr:MULTISPECIES: hypothetical protein [unclassified Flavobacterium]RTY67082.1 hypothetical protein EKL95_09895 [Flavobacterium sp. LB2P53]RTY89308.1 hypothetical protein EKM01_14440 [Flavobacterium sp. RSP46]RTZ03093.1 hypothetical protein EKM03_13380 [Flavobacterium sp. GSP6]
MLTKTIESLKFLLLEYRFYFCSIALLLALLIYSYNKTLSLEKELQLNQTTFERRQKAYDEKAKQQREKLERMIKEIKSEK